MLIIGESLNATRKHVRAAVETRDVAVIQALALQQVAAGAQMLDVNAAVPGHREVEDLPWMVRTVQASVDVPLVLDSADGEALAAAIAVHHGRPMVNSLSAETAKLKELLPVVAGADCSVIVLCMDDQGIPGDVEGRLKAARDGVSPLLEAGKQPQDILVDPLVMAAAVDASAPLTTLQVLRRLAAGELSGVRTIGGLSNVSYGLPARPLLNRAFLSMAMAMGLDACIVDVRDRALVSAVYATMSLLGEDGQRAYLRAYRKGLLSV